MTEASAPSNQAFHDAVRLAVIDGFSSAEVQLIITHNATAAANTAIRDTMLKMGMDPDKPGEMAADMIHLREWRTTMTLLKRHGFKTVLASALAGVIALLSLGVHMVLNRSS